MSIAKNAFSLAISDAIEIISCYDILNSSGDSNQPPEVLKRAALTMTLTAWETYVEDVASELIEAKYGMVMGSQVGHIINNRLNEQLKVFNNPDSKKTKDLFLEFFGIDVTESWIWGNYQIAKDAITALNAWLKKRGEAVHRAQTNQQSTHIVKRDELDKYIRFFQDLVDVTDRTLMTL
jgi:hypothetical protein